MAGWLDGSNELSIFIEVALLHCSIEFFSCYSFKHKIPIPLFAMRNRFNKTFNLQQILNSDPDCSTGAVNLHEFIADTCLFN